MIIGQTYSTNDFNKLRTQITTKRLTGLVEHHFGSGYTMFINYIEGTIHGPRHTTDGNGVLIETVYYIYGDKQ